VVKVVGINHNGCIGSALAAPVAQAAAVPASSRVRSFIGVFFGKRCSMAILAPQVSRHDPALPSVSAKH
jgi:hypothetical protein